MQKLHLNAPVLHLDYVCVTVQSQESTAPLLRAVVADDHDAIRAQILEIIRAELEVAAAACDGLSAVQLCQECEPDLLLVDVSMPGMSGFEAARLARIRLPKLKIIFVSSHASPVYVDAARALGASAYVMKRSLQVALREALRIVLDGGEFWPETYEVEEWQQHLG